MGFIENVLFVSIIAEEDDVKFAYFFYVRGCESCVIHKDRVEDLRDTRCPTCRCSINLDTQDTSKNTTLILTKQIKTPCLMSP